MFKKLNLKPFYNTYVDDVLNDFYEMVLKEAVVYNRVSAYFSSKSLAAYSKGISNIVNKCGKINFIISESISEEDFVEIVEGYKNREKIEKKLLSALDERININDEMYLSNLSYLIAHNILDIKIAFVKKGIFHDKFGLLYDEERNCIYFRGSNNETESAINENYESFEVSCSWNDNEFESQKIYNSENIFNRLWNNEVIGVETIEIPEVVKRKILSFNKGRVYSEKEIESYNCIYLDITNDEKMTIENNLLENIFTNRDTYFQIYLNRYIYIDSNLSIKFKNVNNYIDMKKVISRLSEYCLRKNIPLVISKKLKIYLNNKDMQIEERKKIGIDIKNKEEYLKSSFEEFENILNVEMERKLREPQLWDAFHMVKMWKSANFSVPGAGKTSIVYGAFAFLNSKSINKVDKILMIGPKNSFYAWIDEFKMNFGNKKILNILNMQNSKYTNSKDKIRDLRYFSSDKNLILVNYESLPSLGEALKEIINERTFLVFDEIHKIKGIDAVRASVALSLAPMVKYKVALTGTPIPNGYQDIYNILKILYPDEYDFMFNFKVDKLKNANEIYAKEINEKIYPFYCRTTKGELGIPLPNEDILITESMTKEERILFQFLYKKYKKSILALYVRLMQASSNPKLLLKKIEIEDYYNIFIDTEKENREYSDDELENDFIIEEINELEMVNIINKIDFSSKFKKGIKKINELTAENKKVLVWGIFVDTLDIISKILNDNGIRNSVIDGRVSYDDRERIINEFKNGNIQVLIANPNTLAESVSLHQVCHDAIYFEYSFNLTHMLQSKDRINRLGLDSEQYTQYYYLILDNVESDRYNSIDKKIYYRLKEKERIMLDAIEGTELKRIDFNDEDDLKLILEKQ